MHKWSKIAVWILSVMAGWGILSQVNLVSATSNSDGVQSAVYQLNEVKDLELESQRIYLEDLTDGLSFYEQQADERTEIASLTKIMTVLVFLENFKGSLKDVVTISKDMLNVHPEYVVIGYEVGDQVTVEDLLYGTMLPSAADSAMGLAILDSKTVEDFVAKMNQKAAKLGLSQTHFSNPFGMDKADTLEVWPDTKKADNYSTAREVAMFLKEALKNETFRKIFEAANYTMSDGRRIYKTTVETVKRNNLEARRILGAKTGYSGGAKRCLASIARFDDREFLLINLNADDATAHITDAQKIYELMDKKYDERVVLKAEETVAEVPVKWGKQDKYKVRLTEDVTMYLPVRVGEIETSFESNEAIKRGGEEGEIFWDIQKGDEIGEVILSVGGQEIARQKAVLLDEISYINYPLIFGGVGVVLATSGVIVCRKKRREKVSKTRHGNLKLRR